MLGCGRVPRARAFRVSQAPPGSRMRHRSLATSMACGFFPGTRGFSILNNVVNTHQLAVPKSPETSIDRGSCPSGRTPSTYARRLRWAFASIASCRSSATILRRHSSKSRVTFEGSNRIEVGGGRASIPETEWIECWPACYHSRAGTVGNLDVPQSQAPCIGVP